MRNKLLGCMMLLLCAVGMYGQNIKISERIQQDNGVSVMARKEVKVDANGDACALIVVKTTDFKYKINGDLGVIQTEMRKDENEIWLWVPNGTSELDFTHPELGNYTYPLGFDVKSKNGYTLKMDDDIEVVKRERANAAFVAFNILPEIKGVQVFIDGIIQANPGNMSLRIGKHQYKIEDPESFYELQEGTIDITSPSRIDTTFKLKPAFGYLSISSKPMGADIYIDNELIGKTSSNPLRTDRLRKGTHKIKAVVNMFEPLVQQVEVMPDGQFQPLNLTLAKNYADIALKCDDSEAELAINDEVKGKGTWVGKLSAGTYNIECRRLGYRSALKTIDVKIGKEQTIKFNALVPKFGSLSINCNEKAETWLDNNKLGMVPNNFENILEGTYRLTVKKDGFEDYSEKISVAEFKQTNMNVTLKPIEYVELTIRKDAESILEIDGKGVLATGKEEYITPKYPVNSYHTIRVLKGLHEKTQGVRATLNSAPIDMTMIGTLQIKSTKGATVSVNNEPTNKYRTRQPALGEYEIRVRQDGYKSGHWKITVDEKENKTLKASLKVKGSTFISYIYSPKAQVGAMVGWCQYIGAYATFKTYTTSSDAIIQEEDSSDITSMEFQKSGHTGWSIGPMFRLFKGCYLYGGAGTGIFTAFYGPSKDRLTPLSEVKGLEAEAGAILKFGKFTVQGGYVTILGDQRFADFTVGVGVAF